MRQANIEKMDAKISTLETRLKQEKAKKQAAKNRMRAAANKATRTAETRRKILVGALVLKAFTRKDKPFNIKYLAELLDCELTRPEDRKLFSDLIPLKMDYQN